MTWLFLRAELGEEFAQLTWRAQDIACAMEWLHCQRRARAQEAARFRVRRRPSVKQRKAKRARERMRYRTDDEWRANRLAYHKGWFERNKAGTYKRERERYHTDAEYRARKLAYGRAAYQRLRSDPKRWARLLGQIRKSKAARRGS